MRVGAAVLESTHGETIVLEKVSADAKINGLLAEVTITQYYRNPEATNIEAVYTFPLPVDGVLLGFEVEIGERRLVGTVVEKADSERHYEDAIAGGDTAVLLERAEPGLYTASVGNLLPGETAAVCVRYGVLLRWNGDRVRFTLPTTVAPRYGDPASAGLAPHQAPEHAFGAERAFSLRVRVRGLLKAARFNSPTHSVRVAPAEEATTITLIGAPTMDRNFILEAHLSQPDSTSALVSRDLDGWVVLASFRPDIPAANHVQPRSVKIVVDCSGSMAGDSITQAREALARILDGLRKDDLFEIIAFGSNHRALFGGETPISETSLAQARRFVRSLDANMGGTEIGAALEAAYALPRASSLPQDLFLVTDGNAWNSNELIARAKRSGHRFFTVGVGSAVTEAFVRELAEATDGACEFVAPREDMAERIHRHFQRLNAPRAEGAVVRWPAPALRSLPGPIGTVYGGDTVHIFAWFADKPAGDARLDVTLADGRIVSSEGRIMPIDEQFAELSPCDEAMPCTLARLAAARCLIVGTDEKGVTEIAIRYQLMSQWTNYIVTHVRAEKAEDLPKTVKVPHVLAAGWHGMGTVRISARIPSDTDDSLVLSAREARAFRAHSTQWMYSRSMRSAVSGTIGLAELVELLNAHTAPSLPTLDNLDSWGVPEAVLVMLRNLVTEGVEEAIVMATFLHLLSESDVGKALDRQVLRHILKAYKATIPQEGAVTKAITSALHSWPNQDTAEGIEP